MAGRNLSPLACAARAWQSCRISNGYSQTSTPGRNVYGLVVHLTSTFARGAKTKTTLKLSDLPQGALAPLPLLETDDDPAPTYPPLIQQHLNHVKKFKDCVVLTRVGNFYEMYAEQAAEYGPLLNLKVAQRRTTLGPVAMSGFQYFQLDRYLKILVQDLNKQVAISEEIRNTAADQARGSGLLYDRKVNRVITAGTLIDENFTDPYENNYLLSIHAASDLSATSGESVLLGPAEPKRDRTTGIGLSWVDLSSGDFFTQTTELAALSSVLARIDPREIVLDMSMENPDQTLLRGVLGDASHSITYHKRNMHDDWQTIVDSTGDLDLSDFSEEELDATSLLVDYVRDRLFDLNISLRMPVRRLDGDFMSIDKQSLRGLEVRTTIREALYEGSLLHAIRRTVTKSGARLLRQRLVSPSMSLSVINDRLDLVSEFLRHESLRESTTELLRRTFDTLRLLQKFSIGRGDADDLLGLAKTIDIMAELEGMMHDHIVSQQSRTSEPEPHPAQPEELIFLWNILRSLDLEKPRQLAVRIQQSIDEDNLTRQHQVEEAEAAELSGLAEKVLGEDDESNRAVQQKSTFAKKASRAAASKDSEDDNREIWVMRRSASKTLKRAHAELDDLMMEKLQLGNSLRERLGSNSLTLRWTAQLGHFCHVKGKDAKADMDGARTISSTKTTRSLYLTDWTKLGVRIEEAKLRIRSEEQRVFASLRHEVILNLLRLRRNAAVLDELDVACSSATLAKERNLVRPILNHGTTHRIIGGRHPMVDVSLRDSGRLFTANDCTVGGPSSILLITGPNMAGKSTYLRQNALISILAQTGCFVPADYAEIGLVDKIFSRVGSADDLYHHQSTFMVEMLEVAEILNHATPRSFVIMDEVGRGTTPEDGVAVGFACLQHLHERNRCRTLFATHFHALADLTAAFERVARFCTDVAEEKDGSWVYVHKLRQGVNRESHALKVARLAGLPEEAIVVAANVLEDLKRLHQEQQIRQEAGTPPGELCKMAAHAS